MINGIINFFKPKGMTSHQAVNFLRRKLNIKRVGHSGTLDPEVAGVLLLCIGKATRVSEYLLEADKTYIAELTLGMETETQDMEGKVINFSNKNVSKDEIIDIFSKFIGEIEQVPPMYSAVKHKGKKLYELAREGIKVDRKKRKATIYDMEILDINEEAKKILFKVRCSKGTYIRTLCNDIGRSLGTYGYMSYLIRTETDGINISDSLGKDTIDNMEVEELKKFLIPMEYAVRELPKIIVEDKFFYNISNGEKIDIKNIDNDLIVESEEYRVYCDNKFIGIGIMEENNDNKYLKMRKVLLA